MSILLDRDHHGVRYSSVGIGTWAIGGPYWTEGEPTGWGGPLDDIDSVKALSLAIDNGLTHIDTADVYGLGRAERLVGQAIRGHRREQVTLASKVGFVATSAPSAYSPENIRFQLEQSLRNLGTDYLDVYYLHHCYFGNDDAFLAGAVEELAAARSRGLVRAVGLSGYSAADLMRISAVLKPDVIQSWASFEHPEFIRPGGDLAQFMASNDIGFVAMMPYGQGRLLGKYRGAKSSPQFETGDNRLTNSEFSRESLNMIDSKLDKLRERFGNRPEDLIVPALGFIVKHPAVISVVPGFRNTAQVENLIHAVSRDFEEDDLAFVAATFPYSPENNHPWAE